MDSVEGGRGVKTRVFRNTEESGRAGVWGAERVGEGAAAGRGRMSLGDVLGDCI